ncbi:aspartic proteinase nepenthesin-1 [Quillaja saponaria]|uniref:Aspartic proteinase nepenthesin-1 n=1 Tax=Quillaja saponaria TaxID=32244 RepID=A0AAD7PKM3_QUISA|nr:aspartic proteinase nepenthesin-1 [Quillaja saponaria]
MDSTFPSSHSIPLFLPLSITITISVLLSHSLSSSTPPPIPGFRVSLNRIGARQNFTHIQLIQRAIYHGKCRVEKLTATMTPAPCNGLQAPIHAGIGEFLVNLSIGTPPLPLNAIVDTGNDLVSTQCKPCKHCCTQPNSIFDPTQSSSYSNISFSKGSCKALGNDSKCDNYVCKYLISYGDDSTTEGLLAKETFTFGDSFQQVSVPNVSFGCEVNNQERWNQTGGLVELGRGPLSLISQLGLKKFSYCLTSSTSNSTNTLFFGSQPYLNSSTIVKVTQLLQNTILRTYYYIPLEGITVGETLLPIQKSLFEINKDGSRGVILDSGTTMTLLHEDAYDLLRQAFLVLSKLHISKRGPKGLDLRFDLPSQSDEDIEVPKLILHFTGFDLKLPTENYVIPDKGLGVVCLTIGPAGSPFVLVNMMQQNFLVLHDLEKERLSFMPT